MSGDDYPNDWQSIVLVPVVDVRIVRMCVYQWFVPMLVSVRLRIRHGWIGRHVGVLMMLVV